MKGKGKRGGNVRTHYATSQAGLTDNGRPTQGNSIGPCVDHFISCESVAAGATSDIVGNVVLDADGLDPGTFGDDVNVVTDSGASSNTIKMQQWASKALSAGQWADFSNKDVILIAASKATKDAAKSAASAGSGSIYIGDGTGSGVLRVQPYLSGWLSVAEAGNDTKTTDQTLIGAAREGEDHIYAAVKRTSSYVLEHWADGVMSDSQDFSGESTAWKTEWNAFAPSDFWAAGLSAYALPLTPQSVSNHVVYPQDYYGILICSFSNGAPTDLADALPWMLTEWAAGNKVVWPGWSTLT